MIQQLLNGLSTGALYALVAMGLALVFGVLRVVQMAFGEFLTAAAYGAFVGATLLSQQPILGLLLGAILGAAVTAFVIV